MLRRRQHLSQAELARRIGIRAGPMNNIEQGRNLPSTPVLWRISSVLGVSVDELLQEGADKLTLTTDSLIAARNTGLTAVTAIAGAEFTRQADEQPRLPEALLHRLDAVARDYLALEDICNAPKRATIPLHLPCEPSVAGMERLADKVRRLLGIGHAVVFDYVELLENAGLRVVFMSLPEPLESLSCYDHANGNAFLFVQSGRNHERQLFRLLYELGRVYLHTRRVLGSSRRGEADCLDDDHASRQFAAHFLMPAEAVHASVRQTGAHPDCFPYELMLRLKHRFGVSAESFAIRLEELGLVMPKIAQQAKERIRVHYRKTAFGEPDSSRRILTPNGRLGDLLLIAGGCRSGQSEAVEIRRRLARVCKGGDSGQRTGFPHRRKPQVQSERSKRRVAQ